VDGLLRDTIARIAGPGQVVEVRALTDQFTHSGYFSDPALLVRAVEPLDADNSVHGIYVTLNEVNPALLSRRANRIKMRLGKKDSTKRATRAIPTVRLAVQSGTLPVIKCRIRMITGWCTR